MAIKCSKCGQKAGGAFQQKAYQCQNCGSVICRDCAKKFNQAVVALNAKKTVCPQCGKKGFKSI